MRILLLFLSLAIANASADEFGKRSESGEIVQYYDYSISGLNEYMRDLKVSNPVAYEELKPEIQEMTDRADKVGKINLAILGTSAILSYFAMEVTTVKKTERYTLGNEEHYRDVEEYEYRNKNLWGLVLAGLVSSYYISNKWGVSEKEVKGFINRHNRINPSSQLKFAFSTPVENDEESFSMTLSYAF